MRLKPLGGNYSRILPGGPEAWKRILLAAVIVAAVTAASVNWVSALYIVHTVKASVQSEVETATLRAARHNCQTEQHGRASSNRLRFALRELLRFDTDLITASQHNPSATPAQKHRLTAYLASERRRLTRDYRRARKSIPGLRPIKDFRDLYPLLSNVAQIGCSTALLTR